MFLGIRVTMPCDEHKLPRFHADDNGQKVPADMMAGRVLKDAFPSRQLKFVLAWNEIMNHPLAWNLNGNNDAADCSDIDPETLYALEHAADVHEAV